jgi:hypothetical protein
MLPVTKTASAPLRGASVLGPGIVTVGLGLYRHRAFLVRAAEDRRLFAVAGDDPHPLVELVDDVFRCRRFEKRDAVLAAGGKDAFARLAHHRRVRIARDLEIAESQTEITRTQFRKAEARYGDDLLTIGDTLGTLQLDAEQ